MKVPLFLRITRVQLLLHLRYRKIDENRILWYIFIQYVPRKAVFNLGNGDKLLIEPVAYIKNGYKEKFGVPRQSGLAPSVKSVIEFCDGYKDENMLRDIEQYSHLWLVWGFSQNNGQWSPTVRPPRLGGNKRIGVFATRSPFRPNSLGLSCVKLEEVVNGKNGNTLIVSGADLADNTPIYDIKPYLPYVDSIPDAKGGFSDDFKDYELEVNIPENLKVALTSLEIKNLTDLLSLDPRPSYQNDEERIYGLSFEDMQVRFKYTDTKIQVVDITRG